MGYEIKLIIGEKVPGLVKLDEGRDYLMKIGEFDLCKTTLNLNKKLGVKVYTFMDDGNTKIVDDKYGAEFLAYPAKHIIKAIQEHEKDAKIRHGYKYPDTPYVPYRRHTIAIKHLKELLKHFPEDRLYVGIFCH